ncbi:hypothetical protein BDW59DRAFT_165598 [Aspergillus cavernicola]|uniref:Uncharacterized protein n=1 Tax=Aspergillus cavernicola TaxID=176166 RepID=A0ABR4HRN1_9EURO
MLLLNSTLAPRREYYPKDKRYQRRAFWEPNVAAYIQHDGFEPAVDAIIGKSERLSQFAAETAAHPTTKKQPGISYLRERAHWRRSIFESPDTLSQPIVRLEDQPYDPRDWLRTSKRVSNVREVVALPRERPESIYTTRDLAGLLERWSSIVDMQAHSVAMILENTFP